MPQAEKIQPLPELFFAIAGPIGVDIEAICESLCDALRTVRYEAQTIHLTKEMNQYPLHTTITRGEEPGFFTDVLYKIEYANALCKEADDPGTLGRIALRAIYQRRRQLNNGVVKLPEKPTAYVIRQLKRPEEVSLLRKVYGKQFLLISAYGSADKRKQLLESRIARSLSPSTQANEVSNRADELIARDASEDGDDYGQHLRDTFHLADVFIDGLSRQEMDAKLTRFIQAFFGRTDITPSKEEYGMYAAKSASLRSADLSRQVGAAIFTDDGELVTQGCNEVPKAFGGTYWDLETPDFRDVRIGYDPNDILKKELLRDVLDRMKRADLLSPKALSLGAAGEMVDTLTAKRAQRDGQDGVLANALIMDLTEYGRVVHAEMCALCDAARLGKSVKKATLFCTTFPCHNCTKHILAAGIRRVVYMEPYPKSRAKDLHQNEIEIESESSERVAFVPFLGIAPSRYRDIFEKGKRKKADGSAKRWVSDTERPMLSVSPPVYFELELGEFSSMIGTEENQSQDAVERPSDDATAVPVVPVVVPTE